MKKEMPSREIMDYAAKVFGVEGVSDEMILDEAMRRMGLRRLSQYPHNYSQLVLQAAHDAAR